MKPSIEFTTERKCRAVHDITNLVSWLSVTEGVDQNFVNGCLDYLKLLNAELAAVSEDN